MENQILLLRAMLAGEQPATPANVVAAFNKQVVTARAVTTQQNAVDSTIEILETERERLQQLVDLQRQRNNHLEELLLAEEAVRAAETPQGLEPGVDLEKVRRHISTLATRYLAPLGLGEPLMVEKVLWRLLEVGSRDEKLIVPADMPIVKFLSEEGLIESEPAYGGQLRIQLI